MDNEQNHSLLESIANIGAAAITTLKSAVAAVSTTIGLTAGNGDGKEIEQQHTVVQAYKLTKPGYTSPATDINSCKEQALPFGYAWNLQAKQTKTDNFLCSPDPESPDYDPNARTVNLQVLRTGDADPIVTEIKPETTKPATPPVASTAPKR